MKKILLLEDDIEISEMVSDFLWGEGFEVEQVYCAKDAISKFEDDNYSLVLVDLMLPDFNGFHVIEKIRMKSTIPIIVITAKDTDVDKTTGFNLGADDYVTKPFSLYELLARVKSNIRRVVEYDEVEKTILDDIVTLKDLSINISKHSVYRNDEEIKLTFTEFEILKLLAQNPGRAFSKEELYNNIWKEPYYGNEHVLNAHVNRLRNKLKNNSSYNYIETLWGIGYKVERK